MKDFNENWSLFSRQQIEGKIIALSDISYYNRVDINIKIGISILKGDRQ